MLEKFKTIRTDGSHEIILKKSRFICHLKRTATEEEATRFIQQIKQKEKKANHNCSAYIIGEHDEHQRAHDDGEPSGTAGVPMLDVLKKQELKNVTAVVTRYFGGIKLGKGGLVRAYSTAVSEAVKELGVVERSLYQEIHLTVPYTLSGKTENSLKESSYILRDIQYTDKVTFVCYVPIVQTQNFISETTQWLNDQGNYQLKEKKYMEIPI
ncbi:YigZ family protein [Lacticigenium naphthae]|uniref:YigZ family protein n=1 Tax=Lacticigenium naphthae TaxID=515351 RepID=UPI00042733E5|nr:YigZ family protein [Lacticigenium naphthae]